ncbi:MAG: hypothetical protein ABI972_25930 [Acidobacteriota bacterium]
MKDAQSDFWWLVASEATLFLSLAFWEPTASYGKPLTQPIAFSVSLILGATIAMMLCHVGPALFAARCGPWTTRWRWVLFVWLAAGFMDWWFSLTAVTFSALMSKPFGVVMLVFSGCAGIVTRLGRVLTSSVLLLSLGLLAWALVTNIKGVGIQNGYQPQFQENLEWWFGRGILIAAGPAIVIAYRVGEFEARRSRIFLSGFVGVWIPIVVAMTSASVALEAGANLHWRPSLPIDIMWALVGIGQVLGSATFVIVSLTLLGPAVVAVGAVRDLVTASPSRIRMAAAFGLSIAIAWALQWLYRRDGAGGLLSTSQHQVWASTLWMLGALAGVVAVVKQKSRPG